MSTNISSHYSLNPSDYVLATGARAVGRLLMLDDIYAPAGKRGLLKAGLKAGMHVADFGCGVGAMTRNLAEMVGPNGRATGIDIHEPQLVEAANQCARCGLSNVSFCKADACDTKLSDNMFDLVYCRLPKCPHGGQWTKSGVSFHYPNLWWGRMPLMEDNAVYHPVAFLRRAESVGNQLATFRQVNRLHAAGHFPRLYKKSPLESHRKVRTGHQQGGNCLGD
jgi:SAM-dependent methyltransferase